MPVHIDDEQWEYNIYTRVYSYLDLIRNLWQNSDMLCDTVGVFDTGVEPAGLMYRVYSTPQRSAVKGFTFLPFIKARTLWPTGACRYSAALQRVCAAGKLAIENIVVLYRQMHFGTDIQPVLIFIPKDIYTEGATEGTLRLSLTFEELKKLSKGRVSYKVKQKAMKLLNVAR